MNRNNGVRYYNYVGSPEIKASAIDSAVGTLVKSISDLKEWIVSNSDRPTPKNSILAATFVIDANGYLRLSDRHAEHVACAGGKPVLSAGEIFFSYQPNAIEIVDISNQSTGYCPEPESWQHVENALREMDLSYPNGFTLEFTFRGCTNCQQINIIKNNLFICCTCHCPLPSKWNCNNCMNLSR